jgi:hypothetical protein
VRCLPTALRLPFVLSGDVGTSRPEEQLLVETTRSDAPTLIQKRLISPQAGRAGFGGTEAELLALTECADVSVCLKNPGFDVDVIVSADIVAFYRVWLGRVSFSEALHSQKRTVVGDVPA